jgi:hypothetical protein
MSKLGKARRFTGTAAGPKARIRSQHASEPFIPGTRCQTLALKTWLAACIFLLCSGTLRAQEPVQATASNSNPIDLTNEVRALSDTVRQLQGQVQSLNAELSEILAKEPVCKPEPDATSRVSLEKCAAASGITDPYLTLPSREQVSGSTFGWTSSSTTAVSSPSQTETLQERVSQLEDNQQLVDSKLTDQYQTKVESGSKYRLRLSGIVLLNMFENRGVVDNADFPEVALEPNPLDSAGAFGGTLRQSQLGLEVFGPNVAGARTSADIKFDFAGGFPTAPNGAVLGLVRLRTGTIRMDWANTSIIAGQDFLFFSPLAPTSLASFALPALSYAGNLWAWTPQVRIEHRTHFSETSSLLLQAGILDSLSGDLPVSQYERYPSWGEESGQPAYAARLAWSQRVLGQNLTVGTGGYYGRQYWGFGRHLDGWAATTDLTMPLGRYFDFTGQFYRGRALGGLGGGIGQGVLLAGPLFSPAVIQGLDSMGGWVQLKFKPVPKLEVNGALGDDNPFASELRRFPSGDSYYGVSLSRNLSPFVNFVYQVRSDVMFSVEYRHLKTYEVGDDAYSATHINVSLGYIF